MRTRFRDVADPWFSYLFMDGRRLATVATRLGWSVESVAQRGEFQSVIFLKRTRRTHTSAPSA